jgi:hypothetical protein
MLKASIGLSTDQRLFLSTLIMVGLAIIGLAGWGGSTRAGRPNRRLSPVKVNGRSSDLNFEARGNDHWRQ